MARIDDIKPSIIDLPESEAMSLIAAMSRGRHTPIKAIAKAKATVEKKVKARDVKMDKLMAGMSKEQLAALVMDMEG